MTGIGVADGGLAMVAAGELIILCLVFLFTRWFCLFRGRDHASQSAAGWPRQRGASCRHRQDEGMRLQGHLHLHAFPHTYASSCLYTPRTSHWRPSSLRLAALWPRKRPSPMRNCSPSSRASETPPPLPPRPRPCPLPLPNLRPRPPSPLLSPMIL